MFEHKGIWMPDGEQHMLAYMEKSPLIGGKGSYQFEKIYLAMKLVRGFRTAVDVGGHIGLWSMHLARRFQHVIAFEPVDTHRECFVRNATGSNIRLIPAALGARNCVESGISRQVAITPSRQQGHSGNTRIDLSQAGDVPLQTLDQYQLQDVDFIKVDTEGFELFVLQGARETLHRCKPALIVEQKPDNAQHYGLREQQAVEWLLSEGWLLRQIWVGDFFFSHPKTV